MTQECHLPEFSERLFEFAYNSEYSNSNKANLAGIPFIPNQQEEKTLAYDIWFKLTKTKGSKWHSLFLQHKVASYCHLSSVATKCKSKFYNTHGSPYFIFKLDNPQYNRILALRNSGEKAYYSAPIFHEMAVLESNYLNSKIDSNSIWIDVLNCKKLTGASFKTKHSITYDTATKAFRHSNPQHLEAIKVKSLHNHGKTIDLNSKTLTNLLNTLKKCAGFQHSNIDEEKSIEELILEITIFAKREYGLSWQLIPVQSKK